MELNQWQFLTLLIVILTIFFKWLIVFVNRCKSFPPGPWGIPILGYTPWIAKNPLKAFTQMARKYGNIYSVNLGNQTVIVLNDWDSIKESLIKQPKAFSGRPYSFVFHEFTHEKDITNGDGPAWKAQRKLTMYILRNLGMGKKSMESRIMDMVHQVIDTLSPADGKDLHMNSLFFEPLVRTNWTLVSADSEVQHSIKQKELEEIFSNISKGLSFGNPVNTLPWLRFCPPNGFNYWKQMRMNELFFSYLRKIVDEHVVKWKEGKLDDFIDYYLAENNNQKTITGSEQVPFNVERISYVLYDLFLAGVDTTNQTCLAGFLQLALNPWIQKKAQEELDEVVGRHRLPTMDDMPRLPYFEALVMEVHRMASIVPFSIPHRTTETVNLLGYTIPKNTTVIQNIYEVHRNPKLWDEPEVFKPERFLTASNKTKVPPYFMPFSIGPRACVGQPLAEMELRLLFSCLLHQFTFSIPQGHPLPSAEPVVELVIKPHPYSLHISKRKD